MASKRPDKNRQPITTREDLDAALAILTEHARVRDDLVRADVRLELQCQAIERRLGLRAPKVETLDGVTLPKELRRPRPIPSPIALAEGQDVLEILRDKAQAAIQSSRHLKEREMVALAQRLPIWPWVASVRGFGDLSFALIVAMTTTVIATPEGMTVKDLCCYDNPAKVWKRLGLAVIDGERQRKVKDRELALRHGYSPQKRAALYVIGDTLMKGNQDGLYHTVYVNRKALEQERHPELSLMVAHKRAMRYMTKLLVKHVWQHWRDATPLPTDAT